MIFRLAVGGCGSHATRSHVIPGKALGFVVTAMFDPSDESIERFVEAIGYRPTRYTDFKEMVTSGEIDAILITSLDECHPEQLLMAIEAGVPVLCDKPLAISAEGLTLVRKALSLAIAKRVPVMSCHPRREPADRPYGWVKAQLKSLMDRFGDLMHVGLDFSYEKPSVDKPWKYERSLLLDHFPHELDFLAWILGGFATTMHAVIDEFDRYCVAGILNDVTFLCHGSRRLDAKTYPETIVLRFDRGDALVNTKTGAVRLRDHETEVVEDLTILPIDYDVRFTRIMEKFAEAIARGVSSDAIQHLLIVNTAAVTLAESGYYEK